MLVVLVGGWSGRFWLGERLAMSLRSEFAGRGFHVSWESAAWVPVDGLLFKGFQVHRDASHTESLLRWNQVTVSKGKSGWRSVHMHAAGSELLLGEGAESLRVTDLSMEVDADREGVQVERWNGMAHGLRVDLKGAVLFAKLDALRDYHKEGQAEPPIPARTNKGLEGVDLTFLRTVGEWLEARQLGDREPRLVVTIGERDAGPGYLLRAELDGTDCEWRKQRFSSLGLTMEWPLSGRTEPISITRVTTMPGDKGRKLQLIVDLARHEVRVDVPSAELHLVPVLAAAVPSLAASLKPFDANQAIHLRLAGVIPWRDKENIQLEGEWATLGPHTLKIQAGRSIPVTKLESEFRQSGETLVMRQLDSGLWGGRLHINEVQLDIKDRTWSVQGARINDIRLEEARRSLGWKNGVSGTANGTWSGSGDFALAAVRVDASLRLASVAFPFPALGGVRQGDAGRFPFDALQAEISHRDQELHLKNLSGELWGGKLQVAEGRVNLGNGTWWVDGGAIREIRIPEMRRDLGLQDRNQKGALHGSWQGGGGTKLVDLTGQGSLGITDEGFHRLPLLGPMSVVFMTLAPGFIEETKSPLATDYSLKNGVLSLRNLNVDSTITKIQATGELNLVTQHADLTARARLRGIAGLPTGLLGRLLTLDGEGPFSDIQWRLRYAIGLEQAAGLGGAAENVVLDTGRITSGVVTDTVENVGKAAKGILGIPFHPYRKEDK